VILLRKLAAAVFAIDLRTLALFRVMLGSIMFVDLFNRAFELRIWYTDWGVMPREWWAQSLDGSYVSLFAANGQTWFVAILYGLEMLATLALLFGWRARAAAILAFVLNGSLMNRDIMVLLGYDVLLQCLLFWSMFLPLSARFSLDAALSDPPPSQPNRYVSTATAGLLLQVMSVYFFSAILKSGKPWHDGSAVDLALQIDGYSTPFGLWLNEFPSLTKILTHFVWYLKQYGPIVVFLLPFQALRFVAMFLFMAMHAGFIVCMNIGPFPWMSITSLTSLLGGWFWDWLDRLSQKREAGKGKEPLRIFYDRDCGFCLKSCLLLRTFLILPRAVIAPAQDTPRAKTLLEANYSWVVIDHDDHAYLKWPAFVVLLKRSPAWFWLGWLLAGKWAVTPGNEVYDAVGRNRGSFGAISGALLPFHSRPLIPGPFAHSVAGFFVGVMLAWNICSIHYLPESLYAFLTPPMRSLRFDQYWDMFAPFPSTEDGWFVLPGELVDGTAVDVFHPEREGVSYDKPKYVAREFKNIRWHKYMERIWSAEFSAHRLWYGRYLCRQWNTTHEGGKKLKTFKMVYMLENSIAFNHHPAVEQRVIGHIECYLN